MIGVGDPLGARILVVDDEPANVRLLERILQSAGFTSVWGLWHMPQLPP